ncbi:MAG: hypothetical protein A3E38_03010 [Candidatus Moranbacteria bacterium RIFCSPHIGHO2_12_FULL_54_9]|nr:MAG: hypothetical protein A2878_03030 [Candidatus Moranbacteria bacterium RIFCSPHIGHO2_01_FULL_54_31]OGI26395.1 MAG: hypothetical protein A3E38_03010 [Candidatus Moranbacteria bacterium RIFCSPHIGHO2_12_FULL_54_9]
MNIFFTYKRESEEARQPSPRGVAVALLFAGALFFGTPHTASAGYWGEPTSAAIMKHTMETIRLAVQGATIGALKVAAIQTLNNQVGQLIGGSASGRPLIITNFNDFLYQQPQQKTELFMNDFFTLTTRGKGSSANYIGAGDSGGIGGSYASYLVSVGRQAIGEGTAAPTLNLEEYTPSPQAMFAEGDWRAFNAFFSNPMNNPYGYAIETEKAYQNKLAMTQQEAVVKALSPGFLPVEKNGTVLAPAGLIGAVTENVQTLGNEMIANATNPAEFLSGVVAATATKMISGLIQNGIGQVQANIQREIGNVTREVNSALGDATSALGPGAAFVRDVNQRTNVNVNSSTNTIKQIGPGL